jgi:hypothetical protein
MESALELGERFVKKFEQFQPIIHLRDEAVFVCSLRLHEMFCAFQHPVCVLLSTCESIERGFARDPVWVDSYIYRSLPSEETRSQLMFFVLDRMEKSSRVKELLGTQVLADGQPIVSSTAFFTRRSATDAIREAVVQNVDKRVFSPFRIDQIAAQRMFIGRKHLVAKLRSSRGSQVIVGPRRIGKSSLGRHLQNLLGNTDYPAGAGRMPRCSYVDVSELGGDASTQLWNSILRHFKLERKDFAAGGRVVKLIGATRKENRNAVIDEARALANLIGGLEGQLTIILDEVDKWIESEAAIAWPTLDRLRAMSDEGRAQVLLIGYESLALAAENDRFPFAGRGNKLPIGPLEHSEVDRLVTKPLEELGLQLEGKEQLLNLIWSTTSGMPHIVQDICHHIVDQAFSHKGNRMVTMAMLNSAINSAPTVRTFRRGVTNCGFPLAEAIAGVVSLADRDTHSEGSAEPHTEGSSASMTISEIASVLEEGGYVYDAPDVERALAYLELRFVLQPIDSSRTRWMWTNEVASETTRQTIDKTGMERWLSSLLRHHLEGTWRARYELLEHAGAAK